MYIYVRCRRTLYSVFERVEKHAPLGVADHCGGAALGDDLHLSISIAILETIYIYLSIFISLLTLPP